MQKLFYTKQEDTFALAVAVLIAIIVIGGLSYLYSQLLGASYVNFAVQSNVPYVQNYARQSSLPQLLAGRQGPDSGARYQQYSDEIRTIPGLLGLDLFDPQGRLAWSSTEGTPGADAQRVTAALTGSVTATALGPESSVAAAYGKKEVLEVYVPLYQTAPVGAASGVARVYLDGTAILAQRDQMLLWEFCLVSLSTAIIVLAFYEVFRKRQKRILQQATTLATIIERSPIGIYTLDRTGTITSFNPKMMEISGAKSADAVIGLNALHLPNYQETGMDKVFRDGLQGKPFDMGIDIVSYTAHKRSYRHYLGAPLFAPDNTTVEGLLLIVEDITERRVLEEEKRDFVTITSHEMRTPLAIIRGSAERLLKLLGKERAAGQMQTMVESIHATSIRLLHIVNDLLDIAALEGKKIKFKKEPFDVAAVVKEVVEELTKQAADKKLSLRFERSSDSPIEALGDRERMHEVATNLIANALQYTGQGGVTVKLERTGAGTVKFSCIDTGAGISREMQAIIFEKFGTVHQQFIKSREYGSGIGLYTSRLIVEGMGGKLELEKSVPGDGSMFTVTLPAAGGSGGSLRPAAKEI
jgi:PAS domain S-box-containing protein